MDPVQLVREGYERAAREGIVAVLSFIHEDIRIEEDRGFIDAGTFHGHEGLLKLYGLFTEQFDDFRMIPREVFAGTEGNVVVAVQLTGVAKTTRIPLQLESFHVHGVENGKSRRMRVFLSRAEALRAAGFDPVDVVRTAYERLRKGGLPHFFELLAPDIEWHEWSELPHARVLRGHDELRPYLETLADGFSSFEFTPTNINETNGAVVVETRFSGTAKHADEQVSLEVVHVWELREGRAFRVRVFGTVDDAIAARGHERA